ncbi:DNA-deoxyinosine glycosylase [Gayadomonas joobiniege]|uniref:DNA-deoxyinosine glycosylase n=1 Tax=Gayadomonas joobiniege TaxID=1234606 RepID=UPI00036E1742|nr:DNA-deoxyinosine glycosylase [Gayadomonas joobiniege]
MQSQSFNAICQNNVKAVILGSMPGMRSLQTQQYYAHPRNAFWPIMSAYFNWPDDLTYEQRLKRLQAGKLGLWDVIANCYREGSLDKNIKSESIEINDFKSLLRRYPNLQTFILNGGTAKRLFIQHVIKKQTFNRAFNYYALPSTSPANASMSLAQKQSAWFSVLELALTQS